MLVSKHPQPSQNSDRSKINAGMGEDNDDNDDETAFCESVLSFRNKHKYTCEFNLTRDF